MTDPTEPEISVMKVKTKSMCTKCETELKTMQLGSGDLFGFSGTGRGAFYCENTKCAHFGLLTVGHSPRTEVVEKTEKL